MVIGGPIAPHPSHGGDGGGWLQLEAGYSYNEFP